MRAVWDAYSVYEGSVGMHAYQCEGSVGCEMMVL